MKTLNNVGKQAISDFLKRRHKNGPDFEYSIECWTIHAQEKGNVTIPGYASNDGQGHSLKMRPNYFDKNEG